MEKFSVAGRMLDANAMIFPNPTKAQHTNALTLKQVDLKFQFMFLMEVNMDPIIYFSIIYTTFLWMNFWQKFTPSSPMD